MKNKVSVLIEHLEKQTGKKVILEDIDDSSVSNKLSKLFDELVPRQGAAETVEGEMIRSINRIWYRYTNDGDFFFKGYGLETAKPSVNYLLKSPVGKQVRPIFIRMQEETSALLRRSTGSGRGIFDFSEQYKDSDPYLNGLNQIAKIIINYVESKNGNHEPNTNDSLSYIDKIKHRH